MHGNAINNESNTQPMDPFNACTVSRPRSTRVWALRQGKPDLEIKVQAIDFHTAFQAPTDRPESNNTMPFPMSPGPSIPSFDTAGARLPTTGEPLWFLGLGKSFSLFDGDLGQNLMNEGFDIWDSMPADYTELSFQ
jgi:hypothetical protein